MKQLLADLRAKGEKATQGEWKISLDSDGEVTRIFSGTEITGCDDNDETFNTICSFPVEKYGYGCAWASNENAEHIALANPQNILLILDAMDKMREALEFYSSQIVPKIELYTTPIFLEDGKNKIGHRASQTLKEVFGNE